MEKAVCVLPEPDMPTKPSTSPRATLNGDVIHNNRFCNSGTV